MVREEAGPPAKEIDLEEVDARLPESLPLLPITLEPRLALVDRGEDLDGGDEPVSRRIRNSTGLRTGMVRGAVSGEGPPGAERVLPGGGSP